MNEHRPFSDLVDGMTAASRARVDERAQLLLDNIQLRAQLAEQAREIENLQRNCETFDANWQACIHERDEARAEIARLRQLADAFVRGPRSPIEPT